MFRVLTIALVVGILSDVYLRYFPLSNYLGHPGAGLTCKPAHVGRFEVRPFLFSSSLNCVWFGVWSPPSENATRALSLSLSSYPNSDPTHTTGAAVAHDDAISARAKKQEKGITLTDAIRPNEGHEVSLTRAAGAKATEGHARSKSLMPEFYVTEMEMYSVSVNAGCVFRIWVFVISYGESGAFV